MNSLTAAAVVALIVAFALFAPSHEAAAADPPGGPLKAGAAAADVTPAEFPFNMPGNFSEHLAERLHHAFHARALVLDDGATAVALVVVDNLGVPQEVLDEAKAAAAARCGVPADRMLVSSTHTHSGPPANAKQGRPAEVAYRARLVEGIAESVARAHAARRPAAVGAAGHPLPDEVFNRRWHLRPGQMPANPFGMYDVVKMNPKNDPAVLDRPAGPTDPELAVLSVRDAKGKPLAVYANYALHYVGGTPPGAASADYFGEFARLMPSRLRGGNDFVAMLSNGASGDINNVPFGGVRPPREPYEQVRLVAAKAADAAWHAVGKIDRHRADVTLGMAQRPITLNTRRPTAEQVEKARAVLAVTGEAEKAKLPRLADVYARRTLALADGPASITVPLQAVRIGDDIAVCAIPFETFVEIGLDLKRRSPFPRTIVVGIANGYNGYLPTPEHHRLGGYETWLGTNRVQEDASVRITDQLLEMLAELKR